MQIITTRLKLSVTKSHSRSDYQANPYQQYSQLKYPNLGERFKAHTNFTQSPNVRTIL